MLSRPIKEGFKGVGRHWAMSISSIIAVTITLFIISLFVMTSYNIQYFTKNMESSMKISVLVDYAFEKDEARIEQSIKQIDGVAKVEFSGKAEEFQYYLDSISDEKTREVFEPLREDNPMHDAYYVETTTGDELEAVADTIGEIEGVYKVNYGGQSTISMVEALGTIRRIGLIVVAGLSLLAIFLIQNTIKLTISAREDEITIMRNVGATNNFIRSPFMIEGMITGFLGAVIPVCVSIWGYRWLFENTNGIVISNMFHLVEPFPFLYFVCLILVAIGVLVGLIGSYLSVTRYLRWKR